MGETAQERFVSLISETFEECFKIRSSVMQVKGMLMYSLRDKSIAHMKESVKSYFDDPFGFDTSPCDELFMDAIKNFPESEDSITTIGASEDSTTMDRVDL